MTPRYTDALLLAARAHEGQHRKGTTIPYIVHPVAVAGLVAQYGGDEDQQIAALLHDVLEDGGMRYEPEITKFGERVLAIVHGCTDGVPDGTGQKADWQIRKRSYLAHLAEASDDVLLVSGCDKLHNARSILDDLANIGPAVFERFQTGRAGTLWYYGQLASLFTERRTATAAALAQTVSAINRLASA